MRDFTKIVKKLIDPFLTDKDFVYSDGYYKIEQPNGIRLMVAFDNGGIDSNSFNIMLLVNSVELDDDKGAHCICYFTGGSISSSPRKISCHDKNSLNSGLQRFIDQYDQVVEPYFSSFTNCSDIADKLSNDIELSSYVGDLYLVSGKIPEAKKSYKAWIEHLPTIQRLDKSKVEKAIDETNAKIKKCELINRA